jgi:hypothetical protein
MIYDVMQVVSLCLGEDAVDHGSWRWMSWRWMMQLSDGHLKEFSVYLKRA